MMRVCDRVTSQDLGGLSWLLLLEYIRHSQHWQSHSIIITENTIIDWFNLFINPIQSNPNPQHPEWEWIIILNELLVVVDDGRRNQWQMRMNERRTAFVFRRCWFYFVWWTWYWCCCCWRIYSHWTQTNVCATTRPQHHLMFDVFIDQPILPTNPQERQPIVIIMMMR